MVRKTFSIPDDVSASMEQAIPERERSKFVSQAIAMAMKECNKQELMDLIKISGNDRPARKSSVELVRELRDEELGNL